MKATDVRRGQLVRFLPRFRTRRVTIRVSVPYGYGSIMGYRVTPSGRGGSEDQAFFVYPDTPIELIK